MTRHFNFRYNSHEPLICIFYNFLYLLLGVITPVPIMFISYSGITANQGAVSPCAYFSKFWIFFYFNSPSRIVGQMPMKIIHLVKGEIIDVFFNERNGEEMAANIQQ